MGDMTPMTLEEVGRLAGVSRSTVSRVINGQSASPAAQERVRAVIDRTGFTPHAAARSLASDRTGVLGVVIPSRVHNLFGDPYFGQLLDGMSTASNAAGAILSLFIFHDDVEEQALYPRVVSRGLVDGIILTASRMRDPLLQRLVHGGRPYVVVGRPDEGGTVPHVDVDNRGGARAVAAHLCGLGRRRIACVAAPQHTTAGVDRLEGFLEGLAAHGVAHDPALVVEGDYGQDSGHAGMRALLAHHPDAVFVASDQMATGALRALREAGLRVPADVAVASFDGLPSSAVADPPLTTVRQPIREVGEQAVRLLLRRVQGEEIDPAVVLPTELVVRQSTAGRADPPGTEPRTEPRIEPGTAPGTEPGTAPA